MRHVVTTAVGVLLTLGVVVAQEPARAAPAKAGGSVAQTLTDLEQQWGKASMAGNADALSPLLADDFVSLDSDGTMRSKAEVLARVKTSKWTVNEIKDLKVTVHGDTAVVTGAWVGKGNDGTKNIDAKERWADTWVKKAGKWQCVVSASAPSK